MRMTRHLLGAALVVSTMTALSLFGAEFAVKTVQGPDDLPSGFSALARRGDLLLDDGRWLALFGTSPRTLVVTTGNYPYGQAMGSLLGLGPSDREVCGDLTFGAPALRFKNKTHYVTYSRFNGNKNAPPEEGVSFIAAGAFADKEGRKADIRTVYLLHPGKGRIDIISTIKNVGRVPFEDLSYGLFFDAYNRYYFNPYHEKRFPRLNVRVHQKKGFHLGLIDLNPAPTGDARRPGRLSPGEAFELRSILLIDSCAVDLLRTIYQIREETAVRASVLFHDYDGDWTELIVREAVTGTIVFRGILENPAHQEILVPPGVYRLQANMYPAVVEELVEIAPDKKNIFTLTSPPLGKLKVRITDSRGNFVRGKISFLGIAPTQSPYFEPENPVETGRSWEGNKNSCFPGRDGLTVRLPVGTYLAGASRGPEYAIDDKVIEVVKEKNRDLVFVIDRVVETPGLVSFDPHLHTTRSDGRPSVAERIRSVAAEGIEVMAATDHNIVTDYAPDLDKLGLAGKLTVIPGCEVTTPDVLHFNTYPMEIRPGELGNGAIHAIADSASPLFAASRKKNPGAIIQVNHPRAGDLGYFNNLALDLESAATALPGLDLDIDLLEVLNGPHYYYSNQAAIEDWLHLLNRGTVIPIVGSSDSHGIDRGEPGYSRTYVYLADEKQTPLDQEAFIAALKKGRSFVTNGPFIAFEVDGHPAPGHFMTARDGQVDVSLRVRGAPWVDLDEVRLILNGERRIVFPVNPEDGATDDFEQEIRVTLTEDTAICAEAVGAKTLFPVVQRFSGTGSIEDSTPPYALTNPVLIDVDGNGRFDPPLTEKIRPVDAGDAEIRKVSRH
ncbi:MAG: PHP domain-containing protein [Candidatus Aminicenantes bacterium]|nr:PHP domain-containing protein [Candidatus Aminicenantes bacterium]